MNLDVRIGEKVVVDQRKPRHAFSQEVEDPIAVYLRDHEHLVLRGVVAIFEVELGLRSRIALPASHF